MSKELLQKLTIYSILPCVLTIAAVFLNNLFQPQLHWQLKPLENKEVFSKVEGLDNNITTLFKEPFVRAYSNEAYGCPIYDGQMVYVQNKLLQDKLFIVEQWVQINNNFTGILLFLAIIQAGGDVYLLFIYKRVNWGTIVTILILVAFVVIGLVSILGPNISGDIFCLIQKARVEATLTSMSLDGLFYLFLGSIANILAIIIMVKRYLTKPVFEQASENAS